VKLKGQLEQAQLENRSADPSNLPDGLVWLNTTSNRAKAYLQAAIRVFVTEDQAQTLTNKTISAANNTISITPAQLAPGVMSKAQGGTGADNSGVTFPSTGTIPTLASANTWTAANTFQGLLSADTEANASTGADQTLAAPTKLQVRLTGAITSVAGVVAPANAQLLILTNLSGGALTIKNDAVATAANRILTGSGSDISMSNGASLWLIYGTASSRWRVVGGSGGSSVRVATAQPITVGGTIALTNFDSTQIVPVSGSGAAVDLSLTPFGSTASLQDGILAEIICTSDTNTVSFTFNDAPGGVVGNFEKFTLNRFDAAKFRLVKSLDRWIYEI